MKREEGYYWIQRHDDEPEPAEWDGSFWWRTGSDSGVSDDQVTVLSARLIAPPINMPAPSGNYPYDPR